MSLAEAAAISAQLRLGRKHMPRTLAGVREYIERTLGRFDMHPNVTRRDDEANGVPVAWFNPPDHREDTVLVYFHGGAYIMGSIESHASLVSNIAAASGIPALSAGYRLAPEHQFPAQVEDTLTVYRWLLGNGYEPTQIAFGGDSAGGGLTLAALVAIRDEGLPMPACAVVLSPWTDLEVTGPTARERAERDPMLSIDDQPGLIRLLLGEADSRHPLASPLHADLTGLPPLLIHVGGNEILYDDSIRFAEKAKAAGVEVTLDVQEEMFHVWHIFAPVLEEGRMAINEIAAFLQQHLMAED